MIAHYGLISIRLRRNLKKRKMSAGNHKDRIGVSDVDTDSAYLINLSRIVSRACDEYWERVTGRKPLTMRDMMSGYSKKTLRRKKK
jgi:hypothetical protein